MGNIDSIRTKRNGNIESDHNVVTLGDSRRVALTDINDRFGVGESVRQLQALMKEVTKEKITAETVNAACNCVHNINLTIKTAIQAAKFLSDK